MTSGGNISRSLSYVPLRTLPVLSWLLPCEQIMTLLYPVGARFTSMSQF